MTSADIFVLMARGQVLIYLSSWPEDKCFITSPPGKMKLAYNFLVKDRRQVKYFFLVHHESAVKYLFMSLNQN